MLREPSAVEAVLLVRWDRKDGADAVMRPGPALGFGVPVLRCVSLRESRALNFRPGSLSFETLSHERLQ
jgi:hypothetical protein